MSAMISPDDLAQDDNCARLVAKRILHRYLPENKVVDDQLIGFGKGFNEGSICGAISGSIFAINTILSQKDIPENDILTIVNDFKTDFKENYGGIDCNALLTNFVGIEDLKQFDPNVQLKGCSNLLTETLHEINEIIDYTITFADPIMKRFDRL